MSDLFVEAKLNSCRQIIFSKQQGRYTPIFKNKMALCANGSTCIDDDEVDDEDWDYDDDYECLDKSFI